MIVKDGKDVTAEISAYVSEAAKEWRKDNDESFRKSIAALIMSRAYLQSIEPPWMMDNVAEAVEFIEKAIAKLTETKSV